jgi:hypothetical protein
VFGIPRETPKGLEILNQENLKMSVAANNFAAAAFAIVISASLFAYAIVPASPNLIA